MIPCHVIITLILCIIGEDWTLYLTIGNDKRLGVRVMGLIQTSQIQTLSMAPYFLIRNMTEFIFSLQFSPHNRSLLASCSYDFTVRTWDIEGGPHPLESIEHHTEFVVGLDFNLHIPGQVWMDYNRIIKSCLFTQGLFTRWRWGTPGM